MLGGGPTDPCRMDGSPTSRTRRRDRALAEAQPRVATRRGKGGGPWGNHGFPHVGVVIPASVDYVRAGSVEEALDALAQPDAKLLAGGQSLLPAMKLRIARPSVVVDIGDLGLSGIEERNGDLVIGAMTTWSELERTSVRPAFRALADCAAGIGDLQVRNLGTIGGGLAHADPAADMPAVTIALDARLTLRSKAGERTIDAAELALGPFMTSLAEGELITEVVIPVPTRARARRTWPWNIRRPALRSRGRQRSSPRTARNASR